MCPHFAPKMTQKWPKLVKKWTFDNLKLIFKTFLTEFAPPLWELCPLCTGLLQSINYYASSARLICTLVWMLENALQLTIIVDHFGHCVVCATAQVPVVASPVPAFDFQWPEAFPCQNVSRRLELVCTVVVVLVTPQCTVTRKCLEDTLVGLGYH